MAVQARSGLLESEVQYYEFLHLPLPVSALGALLGNLQVGRRLRAPPDWTSPEIMGAWGKWFESIKENVVDIGGNFSGGRRSSSEGIKALPLGLDSITGFTIVSAESLDDAERMAQSCPYVSSIRVYEMMSE